MTPRAALNVATAPFLAHLRTQPRGVITAVVLGGYVTGVLATAGGLVLAGIKIGRRTA